MWALARLAAQLRLRVANRDGGRVRAAPLRGRARTRLGQSECGTLTRPAAILPAKSELAVRLRRRALHNPAHVLDRFSIRGGGECQARAQALQRCVRLGVEAVDRNVRSLDQVVLIAQLERTQKQALEQRRVDEAAGMRVRERLVDGQPLAKAIAEEAAQIEAHPGLA